MMPSRTVAAAVLAGGASRRLGQDKALLMLEGETLLARALRVLADLTDLQLVIGPARRALPARVMCVPDQGVGAGPLAGIFTALANTAAAHTLVVACDMPFLSGPLLRYLVSIRDEADVVLPVVGGLGQQLHAVYAATSRDTIQQHLLAGDLQVSHIFDDLRVRRVDERELRRFDPELRSFVNVNTAEDWAVAQEVH